MAGSAGSQVCYGEGREHSHCNTAVTTCFLQFHSPWFAKQSKGLRRKIQSSAYGKRWSMLEYPETWGAGEMHHVVHMFIRTYANCYRFILRHSGGVFGH